VEQKLTALNHGNRRRMGRTTVAVAAAAGCDCAAVPAVLQFQSKRVPCLVGRHSTAAAPLPRHEQSRWRPASKARAAVGTGQEAFALQAWSRGPADVASPPAALPLPCACAPREMCNYLDPVLC